VLTTTRFDSAETLVQTIEHYVQVYNQHISHKALGHIAPIQALKDWRDKCSKLFKKRVYNLRGLDIYGSAHVRLVINCRHRYASRARRIIDVMHFSRRIVYRRGGSTSDEAGG